MEMVFLCVLCWDVISRTVWGNKLVVGWSGQQFSWVKWCEDHEAGVKWPSAWDPAELSVDKEFRMGGCDKKTWVPEAQESTSVEAIARRRLVKTEDTNLC
jgi:hypothetical protein